MLYAMSSTPSSWSPPESARRLRDLGLTFDDAMSTTTFDVRPPRSLRSQGSLRSKEDGYSSTCGSFVRDEEKSVVVAPPAVPPSALSSPRNSNASIAAIAQYRSMQSLDAFPPGSCRQSLASIQPGKVLSEGSCGSIRTDGAGGSWSSRAPQSPRERDTWVRTLSVGSTVTRGRSESEVGTYIPVPPRCLSSVSGTSVDSSMCGSEDSARPTRGTFRTRNAMRDLEMGTRTQSLSPFGAGPKGRSSIRSPRTSFNEREAGLARARNTQDIMYEELVPRYLTMLLGVVERTGNLPLVPNQGFAELRSIALSNTLLHERLADAQQQLFQEAYLAGPVEMAVSRMRDYVIAAAAREDAVPSPLAVSHSCEAAGKAGNEDRLVVVPHMAYFTTGAAAAKVSQGDCFLACVFGGHNGADSATSCKMAFPALLGAVPCFPDNPCEAFRLAFAEMQSLLARRHALTKSESGTTATAALIKDRMVYAANTGDSHAILVSVVGDSVECERISGHHHVSNPSEVAAVVKRGGRVFPVRGVNRVDGLAQVTRNLGLLHCSHLSHTPEIHVRTLEEHHRYLVLATDGLWDVVTSEEVAEFVMRPASSFRTTTAKDDLVSLWSACSILSVTDGTRSEDGSVSAIEIENFDHDIDGIARRLIQFAKTRGTHDNVGVIVVDLSTLASSQSGTL